jgi:SAM-dependent methyltransferase
VSDPSSRHSALLPTTLRPWQPALSPNAWLRWEATARLLPPEAEDLLEVGCGRGGFAPRLAARYRYLGVEPDPASLDVARVRLAAAGAGGEVREGDVSAVAAAEQFDVVCAFEVLEHVEDDRGALRSWLERLRPGGLLMLTTPAGRDRFAAADEMVGHVRRYDPSELAALLEELGLVHVRVTRFGWPLAYVLEAVRNAIARRLAARTATMSRADRTASSGRLLQPGDGLVAFCVWAAALPFRKLQHLAPDRGPCLVAVARRPYEPTSSST